MSERYILPFTIGTCIVLGLSALTLGNHNETTKVSFRPNIPKVWDEAALADWATPVAGLNVRPSHVSEQEYYALPVDNLRTYPVYYPGREPEGYWEMLQHVGPKALIEPEKLKSEADWIEAGRGVFDEADHPVLRTFGPYHMLSPDTKRVQARLSDEALYALALYIDSLQLPPNPNPFDERAKGGQKIFAREGCEMCHTPPLYTSNKLTLAQGFTPPKDVPAALDILPISVGTDPGLALATRKGTGYYKVPSLRGVWYRGHYLHEGSVASLEDMFDPDRLKGAHVPGGWNPPGTQTRAIKGHEFGLNLTPAERERLIAFLKTL